MMTISGRLSSPRCSSILQRSHRGPASRYLSWAKRMMALKITPGPGSHSDSLPNMCGRDRDISGSGQARVVTTITVSHIPPPVTTTSEPPWRLSSKDIKHVLAIDLSAADHWHARKRAPGEPVDAPFNGVGYTDSLVSQIKPIVAADAQSLQRIDCVRIIGTNPHELPSKEVWDALDGLSPKHLEISAGGHEECDVSHLDALQHQWTDLRSVLMVGVCSDPLLGGGAGYPRAFAHIDALALDYSFQLTFRFPAGAPPLDRLRSLTVIENNALEMFVDLVDNNPKATSTLEEVSLQSTLGHDFARLPEPQDFKNRLRACTRIRELRLAVSRGIDIPDDDSGSDGLDLGLAPYIPPSVEKLVFQASNSKAMLGDLDEWIRLAKDSPAGEWLPHLKSVTMRFDALTVVDLQEGRLKQKEGVVDHSRDVEFGGKRKVFFEALERRGTGIEVNA